MIEQRSTDLDTTEQLTEILGGLSDNHVKALVALLSANSVSQASRDCGLGRTTLYAYMADPEFDTAYQQARRLMLQQSTARLQALSGHFVGTLERIAEGYDMRSIPASAQVAAAKTGLAYAYRSELDEILNKTNRLEDYYGTIQED
jgi:DNA-binding phage protein